MKEKYILYAESYVIVKSDEKNVLLYNTLNNKRFEVYKDHLHIVLLEFLVDIVPKTVNTYLEIDKTTHSELFKNEIFIRLRDAFLIDTVIIPYNTIPLFLSCTPRMQIDAIENSTGNLFTPFDEIFIFINGGEIDNNHGFISNYHKQFNFPVNSTGRTTKPEILVKIFEVIEKFKVRCINLNLHKLNYIKGIDIFFETYLSHKEFRFNIHVTVIEFEELVNSVFGLGFIPEKCYVYFFKLISFCAIIEKTLEYCKTSLPNERFIFCLIIENSKEYRYAENLSKRFPQQIFHYLPFINQKREDSLEPNIAYSLDELFCLNYSQRSIAVNEQVNAYFYGKIIIDSNADIYTSFNLDKIGNLLDPDTNQLKCKLHDHGSVWFLTRSKISPCIDCLYNCFCPPINDINLNLGRFDLCIKENNTYIL